LRVEYAEISLQGARDSNQDRVLAAVAERATLLIACDGMGGHAEGERAAEAAQKLLAERFWHTPQPLFDPLGFLHTALGLAHQRVVEAGAQLPLENRPRATCAVCLVQESSAYWAHVGDSRVYHLRAGRVLERTRDHSHVELLVREGLIGADQVQNHPMRNFVESCLGGELMLPEMSINRRREVRAGDVLMVCTDGLWAHVDDSEIAAALCAEGQPLRASLQVLSERAVVTGGAASDNTSAAAVRILEQP
jgi:serine/threonine protein phosphatase PrpC